MVSEVRRGRSQRQVAREYGVSLSTLQYWLQRSEGQRLDRFAWEDRPSRPLHTTRTPRAMENLVLQVREGLRRDSALGEYGAEAIHRELHSRGFAELPSVRTIGRILLRRGALDGRQRVRRPAPPSGWYLPDVASGQVELDAFDVVEGLVIRGGVDVEVLNGISLHGRLVVSWPVRAVSARSTVDALIDHWQEWGLPHYAQFDNDTRFQAAHQHPDVISRVMRLCLALGVTPVFVPPREHGFQAAIESYNGRWQQKVWSRFDHEDLAQLQQRSVRYVAAYRQRTRERQAIAPARRPFPDPWALDLQAHPQGRLVYLRRTSEAGQVYLLGRRFAVDALWRHRLVRCEVELTEGEIIFHALRRSSPQEQPILATVAYELPHRRFRE